MVPLAQLDAPVAVLGPPNVKALAFETRSDASQQIGVWRANNGCHGPCYSFRLSGALCCMARTIDLRQSQNMTEYMAIMAPE